MAAERSRKRKRKLNQDEAIAKVKKGKEAKKKAGKHHKKKKQPAFDDDDDDDDWAGEDMMDRYRKAKPLPGQLENCENCNKRFTVTPYNKAGPDGGLLCTPCGRELAKEAKAAAKSEKQKTTKARRKMESNRLDGLCLLGPKSLMTICIEMLAQHSGDIEEFGVLPDQVMNRLSEIFSKQRVMNSRTLPLFLRPDMDRVLIHDAACTLAPSSPRHPH